MEGRLLLDIVVSQGSSVFKLLPCKDQSLLIRWYPLLVLDLRLDIGNGIRGLHIKSNRFSSQRLDKNLHSSSQTENQMKCGFLLNVIIGQCSSIFKLLSSKNEPLLVRGNSLLVLNLRLYIGNGIRRLYIKSNRLPCKCLHENLHFVFQTL